MSELEEEYKGLLQTVLEEPLSDDPRLIIADWMEEYTNDAGLLRARLIRLQIELSHEPDPEKEAECWRIMEGREEGCRDNRQSQWWGSLVNPLDMYFRDAIVQRGFLHDVKCDKKVLTRHLHLFRREPVVLVDVPDLPISTVGLPQVPDDEETGYWSRCCLWVNYARESVSLPILKWDDYLGYMLRTRFIKPRDRLDSSLSWDVLSTVAQR